jgi:serine/threonine-protein kinase
VDALQLTLTAQAPAGTVRKAPDLACYSLCLQGRFHANKRTHEGLRKSIACFEQGIAADRSCAVAYAGLADAYSLLADYGLLDPAEAVPKARAAAEEALALDPQCAEAHVSLAFIRSVFDWAWADAESLYRKAIALNPGYSRARHWFGLDHLALLGRFDEAISEVLMAHHLDPLSQILREGCGYIHMLCRDYPKALEIYRELVDLDPTFYKGYSSMARVLFLMHRHDEAIATLEKARSLGGPVPSILAALGQTLACAGRTSEAHAQLDALHTMAKTQWVPSACFAIVSLGLGDRDASLAWLETACEKREMAVTALKVHPIYDPLRGEPRFERLLGRIGLLP